MDIEMKVDPDKLKAIVQSVVGDVKAEVAELRGARGFFAILKAVPHVVARVEKIGADLKLIGEDKKAVAVAAVCALVPDSWLPDSVVAFIASFAIERALPAIKAKLGA